MANPLYLHVGHILPMGMADLNADDADTLPTGVIGGRKYAKGQLGFVKDDFGFRIFRYFHNRHTVATVAGTLYIRAAEVTSTTSAVSTTTSLPKTSGFTANALVGRIAYIKTNASSAGVAPEGESSPIVSNTADACYIDEGYPWSATVPSGSTYEITSIYDFIIASSGELAKDVFGLAVASIGVGNWGMIQQYGYCPAALIDASTAITKDVPLVSASGPVLGPGSSPASKLWVGWAPFGSNSTNSGKTMVFLNTYSPFGPAAAS